MKKFLISTTLIGLIWILFCSFAEAKRLPPKEVEPVIYNGVKYIAPHWGAFHSRKQNGGYIEAWDVETGEKLWEKKVYDVKYDPWLERDVQDVFITSLSIENGKLVVVNERGKTYKINIPKKILKEQPLQLIIKSDKEVYKVGEEIWIEFEFKNIASEQTDLLFESCNLPLYHNFEFFDINGNPMLHTDPAITCTIVVSERKELLLGDKYISKIPLHKWHIIGSGQKYNNVGSEACKILIKGIYSSPPVAGEFIDSDRIFWGTLTSNIITIEIVKDRSAWNELKVGQRKEEISK